MATRLVITLLCFLGFPSPTFTQDWQYHRSGRFVIAYAANEQKLALQVIAELQRQQQTLNQRLEFEPRRTITIFLCPTQYLFDYLTRSVVPDWGEAAADVSNWRMFLKSPAASANRELKPRTLLHELVHLTLAEMVLPGRAPRWFDEGAATLLSGDTQHVSPKLISSAMATRSLVSFDEIEELLTFHNAQAGLAYSESYHAVGYLIQTFGEDAIGRYARALAVHEDARAAFQAAFGKDLWDFETAYFDYLRAKFRWYFLWDDTVLWSAAILLLVVAGFIVTRRRIKRRIQEWEEEERLSAQNKADPEEEKSY